MEATQGGEQMTDRKNEIIKKLNVYLTGRFVGVPKEFPEECVEEAEYIYALIEQELRDTKPLS
jgi:hypothetical protein